MDVFPPEIWGDANNLREKTSLSNKEMATGLQIVGRSVRYADSRRYFKTNAEVSEKPCPGLEIL